MITIYLNSMYNLLFRKNPILMIWDETRKNIKAFRNLRRNMKRAKYKLNDLENRLQRVETYVNYTARREASKFDVTR